MCRVDNVPIGCRCDVGRQRGTSCAGAGSACGTPHIASLVGHVECREVCCCCATLERPLFQRKQSSSSDAMRTRTLADRMLLSCPAAWALEEPTSDPDGVSPRHHGCIMQHQWYRVLLVSPW